MSENAVTPDSAASVRPDDLAFATRFSRFLLLLLQLGLLAAIAYEFAIESGRHFFPVLCVIIAGFVVHAWLPTRLRQGFFALLSAGCVPFVLGLASGLQVLGISAALIGVCYLPVGFRTRLLLLVAAAAALVGLRVQWPLPIWPVLGSMFMFRLMIYVYATRKGPDVPPLATSASYFFLLPNACFPFFPVVDYRTFRDSWFNADEWLIYQRGVTWIVRGFVHLLLYRFIRTHFVPEPYELYDVEHLARFMATNYALYLHVSGQFHVITGLLHLFGFHVPRTHHNYFLASSFTDIWRRINIYWKDFMTKLFFFPAYYALHGRGVTAAAATVVSVLCVFVCTWLLHSWQAFWLLGEFPLSIREAGLWLGAGVCVAVNALWDARRGERRSQAPVWAALSLSARIVGMFALVSLFWALWTSPEFPALVVGAWKRPGFGSGLLRVLSWMLAAAVVGALFILSKSWFGAVEWRRPALVFKDVALLHAVALGGVAAVSSPRFDVLLNESTAQAFTDFRSNAYADDAALAQLRGYYENLNGAAIQAGPLITSLTPQAESRRVQAEGFDKVSRPADAYQYFELIPGIRTELSGSPTSINRFGMRDRDDITLNKPEGIIRIAVVGSSVVMGYGVADDEVFTRVLENRLNAEHPNGPTYQVLNFGVGKQWPSHRMVRIQRQVLGFDPDAIFYFAHQDEFLLTAEHVSGLVSLGLKLPSPYLEEVVERTKVTRDMPPGLIQSRVGARLDELVVAVYRTIVQECRSRGIVPVWIYLPIPTEEAEDISARIIPLAREAGFVVCDLSDWMNGRPREDILPAPDDPHAHAAGHRLIAEALIKMIHEHPESLP